MPPATPTYQAPDITAWTPEEIYRWLCVVEDRLLTKQEREKAYLDRRAGRGVRTPTDEVFEADQCLETDLLALLDLLKKELTP